MLQREVAERLAAPPGGKARGILSVLLQAWYDVEYLFTVDEHVFNPPPKVKSGVIKLTRNGVTDLGCDRICSARWSKPLSASAARCCVPRSKVCLAPPDPAEAAGLMSMRPEQLPVERFVELTNMIARSRSAAS